MTDTPKPAAWLYEHHGKETRHVQNSRDYDSEYVTQSLGYTETPLYTLAAARALIVAEIVAELRNLDGRRDESNLIGWAANHIEAKFGGQSDG